MKTLRYSILILGLLALAGRPAAALIYTYDNETSGTISFAATPCSNPLLRTFTVSDSFTVSAIALGLNVSHNNRGDIRGTLVAPGGSSFQFLTETGDGDNNYDVLFSTNTEGGRDDGDADPTAAPFYNRLVSVGGMNFYSGNSAGTWTLQLCDTVAATNGTFNRARLVLTSATAAAPACTGTVTFDWGSNGNGVAFVSATVGDITYSQGATSDFAGTQSTNSFRTRTTTQGNHTGYYALDMDASAVAGTQDSESVGLISVIDFSQSVNDLSFSLLDVDTANNSWE
ncbi:MAG: proprotein convertase P-domain-containing protein, partial [Acidobacteria bacterium]|nr:proprotein convertase P-domain-containing protein [Acidobacteriota bacterium]